VINNKHALLCNECLLFLPDTGSACPQMCALCRAHKEQKSDFPVWISALVENSAVVPEDHLPKPLRRLIDEKKAAYTVVVRRMDRVMPESALARLIGILKHATDGSAARTAFISFMDEAGFKSITYEQMLALLPIVEPLPNKHIPANTFGFYNLDISKWAPPLPSHVICHQGKMGEKIGFPYRFAAYIKSRIDQEL